MDRDIKTIQTYDESARRLAKYFSGIGPRTKYIELGLKLARADHKARVVEIGCGDGRDAMEIIKRVSFYEGFDPSIELLKLARKKLPRASFVQADTLTYNYPADIDVIYAFASLLHVNLKNMKLTFKKVADSLRTGGIFYISLKEKPDYAEEMKKDEYGERMFYYYNAKIIKELSKDWFMPASISYKLLHNTHWLEIALKRL